MRPGRAGDGEPGTASGAPRHAGRPPAAVKIDGVNPETLAAELRRAGVAEVDAGSRRRAEYSTDASNYRVVPQVVVFPRHAEEVALALRGGPAHRRRR